MAQWSRVERTLYAKLVYYGPAFGGKTTNLVELHRITDPGRTQSLLSITTQDDRTLFFDLLPFDLGSILGHRVALKLYTVPGQVRYGATRRVVLSGADAVVFVADSTPGREADNRESLAGLDRDLRANGIDPRSLPTVLQCNKQDVDGALAPEAMARVLGTGHAAGVPAVAVEGRGVVETFLAAARGMLDRLVALAPPRLRDGIDAAEVARQIERSFAPFRSRDEGAAGSPELPTSASDRDDPVLVAGGDEDLASAETVVALGERLTAERDRAERLERESSALRQLSEMLRHTAMRFDRRTIIDRALEVVSEVVGAAVVSLIAFGSDSGSPVVLGVRGRSRDPLAAHPRGCALLERMHAAVGPCVVDDLREETGTGRGPWTGLRAAVSVPVAARDGSRLYAYAPEPDGRFAESDVRFLATVAAHLAIGLEKSALHAELAARRERLEAEVARRTAELRRACEEMRSLEAAKDRFVSNVSHEMRTPLTSILTAATVIRDYDAGPEARVEMADTILGACETMRGHLDDVFRTVQLEPGGGCLRCEAADPADLVAAAVRLADRGGVPVAIDPDLGPVRVDVARVRRALANLIDNAFKFGASDDGAAVEIAVRRVEDGTVEFVVLDRGPGRPAGDADRLFEPFEQGGEVLRDKPPGIGLGLHESRTVARMHGGDLTWESREGGGSRFGLRVRVDDSEAVPGREACGA